VAKETVMSAAPCSCEEAEALKARVRELEGERAADDAATVVRLQEGIEAVRRARADRDALTARVAEVEAERDAAQRGGCLDCGSPRSTGLPSSTALLNAGWTLVSRLVALCQHMDTGRCDVCRRTHPLPYEVEEAQRLHRAACPEAYDAARSRAAVTPGSGGGLGGGEVGEP
jgi:hypothetical protein